MKLIDKFANKVLNENGSFTITINNDGEDTLNYYFLQNNVGKARYIYGAKSWNDNKLYSNVNLKLKLVAIVSDENIYIVDEIFLQVYKRYVYEEILLPENTIIFDEFVKDKNEYVSNVIFTDFYNALEVEDVTNERTVEECKKRAREYFFSKDLTALYEDEKIGKIFTARDIANVLCGFISIEEESKKRLDREKRDWISKKSINEKIRSLMSDSETIFDWEIEIAEGLRSVDAKTVNVEFEMNGKRASGKVNPDAIIRALKTNGNFSEYDFKVIKQGDKVLEDLGAGGYWSKNPLRCKHINKITYGKKELYVKK